MQVDENLEPNGRGIKSCSNFCNYHPLLGIAGSNLHKFAQSHPTQSCRLNSNPFGPVRPVVYDRFFWAKGAILKTFSYISAMRNKIAAKIQKCVEVCSELRLSHWKKFTSVLRTPIYPYRYCSAKSPPRLPGRDSNHTRDLPCLPAKLNFRNPTHTLLRWLSL